MKVFSGYNGTCIEEFRGHDISIKLIFMSMGIRAEHASPRTKIKALRKQRHNSSSINILNFTKHDSKGKLVLNRYRQMATLILFGYLGRHVY